MVIVSKPMFKSFEVQTDGGFQTIKTGQKIRFVIEE
jgi:Cu/Ag efflux protein CusF